MQLRPSERKRAKIKMALQGASGTGKTYSSLLLAKGLTNGDFSKIAIVDTENGSADLCLSRKLQCFGTTTSLYSRKLHQGYRSL